MSMEKIKQPGKRLQRKGHAARSNAFSERPHLVAKCNKITIL
jgi:hypothetical protein